MTMANVSVIIGMMRMRVTALLARMIAAVAGGASTHGVSAAESYAVLGLAGC